MKIYLYTLCWNEMDILPFVIDYWKRLNITKAIVYDNGSTDGSLEFLSKYDWIEVRHFETNGMNDNKLRDIKNNCWKETKGKDIDFVIVCDMDEIIFSDNLNEILKTMKKDNYNAMITPIYGICEDFKPEHQDGVLLHTQCHKFYVQGMNATYKDMSKIMLFDPNLIDEMNYSVGAHTANTKPNLKLLQTDKAITIHTDKGFGIDYQIKRRKIMDDNRSEENKRLRLSYHYAFPPEKIKNDYLKNQQNSFDINETILKQQTMDD